MELTEKLDTNPFCKVPWVSLAILPNGWVMPCLAVADDNEAYAFGNLNSQSFESIWTGPNAQKFREAHLKKPFKLLNCSSCVEFAKQTRPSRRDEMEQRFATSIKLNNIDYSQTAEPKDIVFLDIAFSNLCNLTCTTCSSKYSTSWAKLDEFILDEGFFHRSKFSPKSSSAENYRKNFESIFKYLGVLQKLLLKGGEPLLNKNCLWFLEELVTRGISKNVSLSIITNGSIINEKIQSLAKSFKNANIVVSLDAVDELYGYIRGGGSAAFKNVVTNIQAFKQIGKNVEVVISPTLQAYNALRLYDLVKLSLEISDDLSFKNWVIEPSYQSVVSLPRGLFPSVISELDRTIAYLKAHSPNNKSILYLSHFIDYLNRSVPWLKAHREDAQMTEKLIHFTRIMNKHRGLKITDIVPEFRGHL